MRFFLSSKLDFPLIKTLERDFFTLSEQNSNVLITGKSNFDEKKWATGQSCIRKEITSYRIGSLLTKDKNTFLIVKDVT